MNLYGFTIALTGYRDGKVFLTHTTNSVDSSNRRPASIVGDYSIREFELDINCDRTIQEGAGFISKALIAAYGMQVESFREAGRDFFSLPIAVGTDGSLDDESFITLYTKILNAKIPPKEARMLSFVFERSKLTQGVFLVSEGVSGDEQLYKEFLEAKKDGFNTKLSWLKLKWDNGDEAAFDDILEMAEQRGKEIAESIKLIHEKEVEEGVEFDDVFYPETTPWGKEYLENKELQDLYPRFCFTKWDPRIHDRLVGTIRVELGMKVNFYYKPASEPASPYYSDTTVAKIWDYADCIEGRLSEEEAFRGDLDSWRNDLSTHFRAKSSELRPSSVEHGV